MRDQDVVHAGLGVRGRVDQVVVVGAHEVERLARTLPELLALRPDRLHSSRSRGAVTAVDVLLDMWTEKHICQTLSRAKRVHRTALMTRMLDIRPLGLYCGNVVSRFHGRVHVATEVLPL